MQWLGKHVPVATNTATELFAALFSVWSVSCQRKRGDSSENFLFSYTITGYGICKIKITS
jgi:hypothetical protein